MGEGQTPAAALEGPAGEDVFDKIIRLKALREGATKKRARSGSAGEIGREAGDEGSECRGGSRSADANANATANAGADAGASAGAGTSGAASQGWMVPRWDAGELVDVVVKERPWRELGQWKDVDEDADDDDDEEYSQWDTLMQSNVAYCLLCGNKFVGTRYAVRRHIANVHEHAMRAEIAAAENVERESEAGEGNATELKSCVAQRTISRRGEGDDEGRIGSVQIDDGKNDEFHGLFAFETLAADVAEVSRAPGHIDARMAATSAGFPLLGDGVGVRDRWNNASVAGAAGSVDTPGDDVVEVTESTASIQCLDSDSAEDANGIVARIGGPCTAGGNTGPEGLFDRLAVLKGGYDHPATGRTSAVARKPFGT